MAEEWKLFAAGNYEVSNEGRIRRAKPGENTWIGRLRQSPIDKSGYFVFGERNKRTRYVHAVVAEAFIGPRISGFVIHHIDGNKLNNRVENLEYVTRGDHMKRHGWVLPPRYKFDDSTIAAVRRLRSEGLLYREIRKETGVSHGHIGNILSGRNR